VKNSTVTSKLGFVHVIVPVAPTAGVVHVHGPVVDSDTNVVPAGSVSVNVALAALLGPLFVIVIVYEMLLPALTGSGESVLVSRRSAAVATVVVAVAELLPGVGSVVADAAVAVLVISVPAAVFDATRTASVNCALPAARLGFEHDTVPLAPTAGVVHVQPAGALSETNVVPAGTASVIVADAALDGPEFVTLIV
jgi:hypothetical protein